MLLININHILYKLTVSRVFIIKAKNEDAEIVLANNTLCFVLAKSENNKIKQYKKKKGFDVLYEYEKLIYKEETYKHVIKGYPNLLNLKLKYNFFLPSMISLLNQDFNTRGKKKMIILKRTAFGFLINCLGINNNVSFFSFFNNLSKNWDLKSGNLFINYKLLLKTMLNRLHTNLFTEVHFLLIRLKNNHKLIKKKKKIIKQTYTKPTLLYILKK